MAGPSPRGGGSIVESEVGQDVLGVREWRDQGPRHDQEHGRQNQEV